MNTIELDNDNAKTGSDLIVDGRTARRQRNKDAVLDALIELANEGDDEPPIEVDRRTGRGVVPIGVPLLRRPNRADAVGDRASDGRTLADLRHREPR